METLLQWIHVHEAVLGWLTVVSVLTFVGSLVVIPWLIVRIPEDYFLQRRPLLDFAGATHPLLRGFAVISKNALGLLLLIAGIAMLVLPGQGIITILVGLMLMDFPGKFAAERWLISRPAVLGTMNWIRSKAGAAALRAPEGPSRP